jgi:DNA-binding NarL/FixJ family response regulator
MVFTRPKMINNPDNDFIVMVANLVLSFTRYSELFGFGGTFQEYEQVTKLSTYGLSSEAIADVLNRDPRTIDKWLAAIGKKVSNFTYLYA